MRIAFVTPPLVKPSEPGLSAAAAARWFRLRGVDAFAVDASIGWYGRTLSAGSLEASMREADLRGYTEGSLQAFRQALRGGTEPLRRPATYQSRKVYSSAASQLVSALRLASVPHPGFHLRVADVEAEGRRPHCAADIQAVAQAPTPFDAYFLEELIPRLTAEGTTHLAISLTFLHQAYAAFRLAHLVRERLPGVLRLLGGPLPACWHAVGACLEGPAFDLFDRVFPRSDPRERESLVSELGGGPYSAPELLAPDLEDTDWGAYFVPMPTVPVALGRGCYWRRCTFCPDYLHPAYHSGGRRALEGWLDEVAERFPGGAMLHLTDSALPPRLLERVAEIVRQRGLPLRWHGFVRLEAAFADPGLAQRLAEGGCAMLQWGLESASARLLAMMEKGVDLPQARAALRSSATAGIRNHVYLLFGLPTETEGDREATLAFVQEEQSVLHDLNASLLNLPRRSPMHADPGAFGITRLSPFGVETDLSLYDDFRCGASHPRLEARQWLGRRFFRDPAVKGIVGNLNAPFKANHSCFLP